MKFITQSRIGTSHNDILALRMVARDLDIEVVSAPQGWRLDLDIVESKDFAIPYGSQYFCEVIAQQMNLKLLQNPFDWLAKVPKKYTKRQIDFMTLGEAKKITETKFIKPADDKVFDAKVYEAGEFNPPSTIDDSYPVLVSEPVTFDLEYRCFVNPYKVLTWSNYVWYGELANPKNYYSTISDFGPENIDHENFVENVLSEITTVHSVVDVGWIPDKGWAIIETNPVWASGLYGCDPMMALTVMMNSVEIDHVHNGM